MLRRLVQQQQRGLLRQRPRQNHALLFAARKLIHPPVAQRVRAHLSQRVSGQQAIFVGFKSQPLAVGIAPLQHVFPDAQRKQQLAFLLHQRDALRARAQIEVADFDAVHFDAPGKRPLDSGEQFQQGRFSAGVRTEDGDQFLLLRLEARGAEREFRRRPVRGRVGVAGLLDFQAHARSRERQSSRASEDEPLPATELIAPSSASSK